MKPAMGGLMKRSRAILEMWEVVSIMRTEIVVREGGMWRFGGGSAIVNSFRGESGMYGDVVDIEERF